jgi:transposase-like protein
MARLRDRGKERLWRRLLRQWRRSGQTIRDFCDQHGVAEPSFYTWRRTIRARDRQARRGPGSDGNGSAAGPPLFVPVRVTPAAPLEIVLGQGRLLRVAAGFDPATLRQLLAVLEERSC